MGLIHNFAIGVIHLLFVAMDILVMIILVKVTYERWHPEWLRSINNAVEPVMKTITGLLETCVARVTGRTYTDKTLIVIFILCLSVVRLIICAIV